MTVSERVICKSKRPVLCIVWPCLPLHWWCSTREREMRRWRSVRAPAQRVSCMLYGGGERYRMVYLCEWSGEVVFVRLHTVLRDAQNTLSLATHVGPQTSNMSIYRPHTPFILSARSPAHKHSLCSPLLSRDRCFRAATYPQISLALSDSLEVSRCLAAAAIARDLHHKHTRDHQSGSKSRTQS